MDSVKEKLVELVCKICSEKTVVFLPDGTTHKRIFYVSEFVDELLANGVTFATDNNVGCKWISVKDRLPEECPHPYDDITKAVLIHTPVDGYTHIGWYAGKDWRGRDEWKTLSTMRSYQTCTKKVSHWCYLPQPPKGE